MADWVSLVSQVAPGRVVSLMMGLWLATAFIGNVIAGWLGGFWSNMDHANFFFLMAALATAAGVVVALLIRPLKSIVEGRAVG
jgi:proton-dependent oligopeptide transporter, POT family